MSNDFAARLIDYGNRVTAPLPKTLSHDEQVDAMMDRLESMAEEALDAMPVLRVFRTFNKTLHRKLPITMSLSLGFAYGWTSVSTMIFGILAHLTKSEFADAMYLAFDRQVTSTRQSLEEWLETGSPDYVMQCQLRRTAERLVEQLGARG